MREAEWESTQKRHQETLCISRSQIGEAERQKVVAEARKNDAFDSLLKMTEKAELFDTKLKGKRLFDFSIVHDLQQSVIMMMVVYGPSFFAEEHIRTWWLEGKVKELTDALRTKHIQTKEVTEQASEELARAKLIKRGADQDLMEALKSVNDMKAQLERAQLERNTLWKARRQ